MLLIPPEAPKTISSPLIPRHTTFMPGRPCKRGLLLSNVAMPRAEVTKVCIRSSSSISSPSGPCKPVRDSSLDSHIARSNKIRFIQKLKTLLLSKPKRFLPIKVLDKSRDYLALSNPPRSILSLIHRYPTVFELFTMHTPPIPFNATKPHSQLCVRLTPAAAALAVREYEIKSKIMSVSSASKLQKLLMLSSHHRLLLSKLVHLFPDLGLPVNFRSRLCNEFPDRFKIVETSYGRALELVSWDSSLAHSLPSPHDEVDSVSLGLIVDRPLKFKHLRLRKGLNLKRRHHDYLMKFKELSHVCPYESKAEDFPKGSIEAEKRACAVVREVLAMTIERRTLIDHLTHFRKEFGLPNKLRALLIRHPEHFYVSLKGLRNSVFLVEGYDGGGRLKEDAKNELLVIRDKLIQLVREGKQLRREKRKAFSKGEDVELVSTSGGGLSCNSMSEEVDEEEFALSYDGLDDLFDDLDDDLGFKDDDLDEEFGVQDGRNDDSGSDSFPSIREEYQFWTTTVEAVIPHNEEDGRCSRPW
ncbi:unnamed protein product [Cuscuta epithymum]|uniref:PORR domain-containing protein n=1 Tax=Cuscuta epithymum TaxID=186058 RepID=A0AAV0E366_9ASTE|nr:unnamed protein product [Cuscuta epithymum]